MTAPSDTVYVGKALSGGWFKFRLNRRVVEYRGEGAVDFGWTPLDSSDWPDLSPSELRAIASLKEAV